MRLFKKYILLLLIGGCFPFLLFSQRNNWEYDLLRTLAEKRIPAGNQFHKGFSKLNRPVCLAVPAGLFITGLLEKDRTLKENALFITGSMVLSSMTTWTLKKIVNRERPAVNDPSFIAVTNELDSGFPSGHTSLAFSMATSLSMKYPRWYVVVPAFAYAGLTGYSRLYLGVHYPTDVVAGALVGSGSAWLTWKLNQWIKREKKKKPAPAL
ncbi:MAG TPA: phosphatase PAP2 family protein [Chitinophagaceae bacterium]|nr:phosphatase PAP2 family protein [Chitinophagaceae bacterium]HPH32088.1 phosphatase PAP2 family protein [Chitinophagaceae bacterium]HPN59159.1 phosphatase PAP2 family protein [Chitinophagaceae bacterium]